MHGNTTRLWNICTWALLLCLYFFFSFFVFFSMNCHELSESGCSAGCGCALTQGCLWGSSFAVHQGCARGLRRGKGKAAAQGAPRWEHLWLWGFGSKWVQGLCLYCTSVERDEALLAPISAAQLWVECPQWVLELGLHNYELGGILWC